MTPIQHAKQLTETAPKPGSCWYTTRSRERHRLCRLFALAGLDDRTALHFLIQWDADNHEKRAPIPVLEQAIDRAYQAVAREAQPKRRRQPIRQPSLYLPAVFAVWNN